MGLDTANKRASALGRAQQFLTVYPIPDGTVVAGDRLQIAWLYRGFADNPPVTYMGLATVTALVLYPSADADALYPTVTAVVVE